MTDSARTPAMAMEPTVFIVDDDAEVRAALQLLMQSVGLPVEAFASAQDYLEGFDPERPGCLVLDIRMPGMSGIEALAEIRKLAAAGRMAFTNYLTQTLIGVAGLLLPEMKLEIRWIANV